jgi:hypothetical protein
MKKQHLRRTQSPGELPWPEANEKPSALGTWQPLPPLDGHPLDGPPSGPAEPLEPVSFDAEEDRIPVGQAIDDRTEGDLGAPDTASHAR